MVLVYVKLIIAYHLSMFLVLGLVFLGDHLVFKQKGHYGFQKMDVIQIVDYLREMQNTQLLQQLLLLKKVIQ